VDGSIVRDPEFPTIAGLHRIEVDGRDIDAISGPHRYLMLNKPRGAVTTASDERGRETVYGCLQGAHVGWVAPVGRLDKASEGLLLFCSDPRWAARITDPETGPHKTYHVQVDRIPDDAMLEAMRAGVACDGGTLRVESVSILRTGAKNAWLEIILDEGRNRHIRRLLAGLGIGVLRLVRVAIGGLRLGELPKGQWRELTAEEIERLSR